jgi:hypothetical protein
MKTKLLTLALLACSALASQAILIGLDSPKFVGTVVDGAPASPVQEVNYINLLINMDTNQTLLPGVSPNLTTETLIRSANFGFPPDAVVDDDSRIDPFVAGQSYSLTNWEYLLVKTGGASYVFYVASLNAGVYELSVPTFPSGISHVSFYNSVPGEEPPFGDEPPGTPVPDGGGTMTILGIALLGLGGVRRLTVARA